MNKEAEESGGVKVIIENRKARFDYHIIETFEAGLVLKGWEIKSIRAGQANISEGYVRPINGELFLLSSHINPYKFTQDYEVNPLRERKLLLNQSEIHKLQTRVKEKGYTIVPLKLYLKRGRAKLLIALAKGKDAPDKREKMKDREAQRDMDRAFRYKNSGDKNLARRQK